MNDDRTSLAQNTQVPKEHLVVICAAVAATCGPHARVIRVRDAAWKGQAAWATIGRVSGPDDHLSKRKGKAHSEHEASSTRETQR